MLRAEVLTTPKEILVAFDNRGLSSLGAGGSFVFSQLLAQSKHRRKGIGQGSKYAGEKVQNRKKRIKEKGLEKKKSLHLDVLSFNTSSTLIASYERVNRWPLGVKFLPPLGPMRRLCLGASVSCLLANSHLTFSWRRTSCKKLNWE